MDTEKKGTGALLDTRSEEKRLKDYTFQELVASVNPVNWVEKPPSSWRKFPIVDQNGSGSCVAQTLAKLLGILVWLKHKTYVAFSATHIYQRRSNRPSAGMAGVEAFDIARQGVTLEALVPSEKMTDGEMDATKVEEYQKQIAAVFKVGNFLVVPTQDIDTVASIIQTTGKGVMVWFFWEYDEWTEVPTIKYPALTAAQGNRHSASAVDFTLYEGEKALIVDDSWGSAYGKAGQRVIKESFFKKRNFFVAYPMNFAFDQGTITKPHYTFTQTLKFSPTFVVDNDVKALQDILKYEGLFPANVDSTGYYGAVTAKAVDAFQRRYSVAPVEELNELQGKVVGLKTITKLNQLYGY